MFALIRRNHVWTFQYARFHSLTLKMKVKYVDDSDEKLYVNSFSYREYVF